MIWTGEMGFQFQLDGRTEISRRRRAVRRRRRSEEMGWEGGWMAGWMDVSIHALWFIKVNL